MKRTHLYLTLAGVFAAALVANTLISNKKNNNAETETHESTSLRTTQENTPEPTEETAWNASSSSEETAASAASSDQEATASAASSDQEATTSTDRSNTKTTASADDTNPETTQATNTASPENRQELDAEPQDSSEMKFISFTGNVTSNQNQSLDDSHLTFFVKQNNVLVSQVSQPALGDFSIKLPKTLSESGPLTLEAHVTLNSTPDSIVLSLDPLPLSATKPNLGSLLLK